MNFDIFGGLEKIGAFFRNFGIFERLRKVRVFFRNFDLFEKVGAFQKSGKVGKGLALGSLVLCGLFCALPFLPARPFSQEGLLFEVEAGQGVRDVAAHLEAEGLILNSFVFSLVSRLTGKDRAIKAGVYELSPGMSLSGVLGLLEDGQGEAFRLTIPEGYSLRQIAGEIERMGIGKSDRFLDFAHGSLFEERFPWLKELPREATLEGYLFPDTYNLGGGFSEVQVIELMLKRFHQVVFPVWEGRKTHNLSLHKAISLASIVELEAKVSSERPLIAGVFFNRLALSMPLGSDPTVEYALGRHQGEKGLSLADVRIDSPYNTYRYAGLPPGPIANPGLASIKAVLSPQETPYLYFVAQGGGRHCFSRTLAGQIQAQRRIQGSMLGSKR